MLTCSIDYHALLAAAGLPPAALLLRELSFPEVLLPRRDKGNEVLLSSAMQLNLTHFKLPKEISLLHPCTPPVTCSPLGSQMESFKIEIR